MATFTFLQPPTPDGQATNVEHFGVEVSVTPNVARLYLRGELDIGAVPLLREQFEQECVSDKHFVVFDASEMTFCDSSGIAALLQAAAQCAAEGRTMRLIHAQPLVRRVIEITDTADSLNLVRDS
jgi:anti-anti-sigma factor